MVASLGRTKYGVPGLGGGTGYVVSHYLFLLIVIFQGHGGDRGRGYPWDKRTSQ